MLKQGDGKRRPISVKITEHHEGVVARFIAPGWSGRASTIFRPTPRRNELRAYTPTRDA